MAKTERGKLNKQLDLLAKAIVKERDGNTCVRCRKTVEGSNRHASHVIPVSAGNKLRWDPLNMKVLCHHCHLQFWHLNPMEAADWFANQYPDRWEYLQSNRGVQKFTIQDLRDLKEKLKKQLNS